jgi:hypothetical protein
MTQRASGSFPSSRVLESLLGPKRQAVLAEAMKAQDAAQVVTSTVIALLEEEHRDRESEWLPAITKARAWLARQSASFDPKSVIFAR